MGIKNGKIPTTDLTEKHLALLVKKTKLSEQEIRDWHASFIQDNPTGRFDQKTYYKTMKELFPHASSDNTLKYDFHRLDRNRDGYVDFEELLLSSVLSSEGTWQDQLSDMFDTCDLSNDGFINVEELTGFLIAMFERFGLPNNFNGMTARQRADQVVEKLSKSRGKKISKSDFIAEFKTGSDLDPIMFPFWERRKSSVESP